MSGRSRRSRCAGDGGNGGGADGGGGGEGGGEASHNVDSNAQRPKIVTLADASDAAVDKLLTRTDLRRRGVAHDAALRRISQVRKRLECLKSEREKERKNIDRFDVTLERKKTRPQ